MVMINIDSLHEERSVSKDLLVKSREVSTGLDVFGEYRKFDLVALTDGSEGVIIFNGSSQCTVLTTNTERRQVAMSQIKGRAETSPRAPHSGCRSQMDRRYTLLWAGADY
jgi:hypothetical protein